jgi:two-component system sensor histidine kinase YesM
MSANLPAQGLALKGTLRTMCAEVPYIRDILVLDRDGGRHSGSRGQSEEGIREMEALAAEGFFDTGTPTAWLRSRDGGVYLKKDIFKVFPLQYLGIIAIRVDEDYLRSIFGSSRDDSWPAAILDSEMKIVTSRAGLDESLVRAVVAAFDPRARRISAPFEHAGKKYYVTALSGSGGEWSILNCEPMDSMLGVWRSMKLLLYVLALALGLVAVVVAILISSSIARNVNTLIASMEEVSSGRLGGVIEVNSRDEIGVLAGHFNRMTGRLSLAMERIVSEESQKHAAEYELLEIKYRSLQSQVSPHFICNILATIDALSCLGENGKAGMLATEAGEYLRSILRKHDRKFLGLREEIELLRGYVGLFASTYGRNVVFSAEAEDSILENSIPNMILQPLVENSLVHGFRPESGGEFRIELRAEAEEGFLRLEVRDNGRGFDPVALAALGRAIADPGVDADTVGFGSYSVLQRLRLLYPGEHSMEVLSEAGKMSSVSIRIPRRR